MSFFQRPADWFRRLRSTPGLYTEYGVILARSPAALVHALAELETVRDVPPEIAMGIGLAIRYGAVVVITGLAYGGGETMVTVRGPKGMPESVFQALAGMRRVVGSWKMVEWVW